MATDATSARVASLAGNPIRVGILQALIDGRALTDNELARAAGITPLTACGHLSQMTAAGLLGVEQRRRHRYYRLASPADAQMLETIMQASGEGGPASRSVATGPRDAALRRARTCYDHLAGQLGVALADALVASGSIELTHEAGELSGVGVAFLTGVGIDIAPLLARRTKRSGRVLCRPCLDWSERRPHLAGIVGAAICAHSLNEGWVRRIPGTRAVTVTRRGERMFRDSFGAHVCEPV